MTDTVDPLAGSYFVEQLTDELEARALKYIVHIDGLGGSVSAIEQGYMQEEIARASYAYQRKVESADKIIVGVNKFTEKEVTAYQSAPHGRLHPQSPIGQARSASRKKKQ